jgi:hypothetical protein
VIAPTFTLVPELLMGTSRIATLPSRLALQMAERLPLRVLACPIAIPKFTENLQWHKYKERDPAIAWLRSLCHETARHFSTPTAKGANAAKNAGPRRGTIANASKTSTGRRRRASRITSARESM